AGALDLLFASAPGDPPPAGSFSSRAGRFGVGCPLGRWLATALPRPLAADARRLGSRKPFSGRRACIRRQQAAWPKAAASHTHSTLALANTEWPCSPGERPRPYVKEAEREIANCPQENGRAERGM